MDCVTINKWVIGSRVKVTTLMCSMVAVKLNVFILRKKHVYRWLQNRASACLRWTNPILLSFNIGNLRFTLYIFLVVMCYVPLYYDSFSSFFILWLQQPWRGIDSGYPFKREQTMLLSHTVLSEKKKKKNIKWLHYCNSYV